MGRMGTVRAFFTLLLLSMVCTAGFAEPPDAAIYSKLRKIKMIVVDVDGVLTNGDIGYTAQGGEVKFFNVKDGLGLLLASQNGFTTVVITGRESPIVEKVAQEFKIKHTLQGVKNKMKSIDELVQRYNLKYEQVCFMGDDLPDLPLLKTVGFSCCPSDAVNQVRDICDFVSEKQSGHGAVREMIDELLKARSQMRASLPSTPSQP
jgi:3-deoxy-D-manno-octulosonate 8-phosphate phosphatase (KDO 8-P phosphatase)